MGSDLLERFQKAGLEASGQRRNVTILFVDLTGFTYLAEQLNNEDLYVMIQELIRTLADDVYKYEGMVDKLTGDGLMALFGAPISYENNVERAIRAALNMQEDVRRLSQTNREKLGYDLQIHIGLNSGSVIVGGMGSNALMNYTAIGDIVNLAKRLEENAKPGAILVSESVYRQTKPLFGFQALPPLGLKGVSHPVTAYQLATAKNIPGKVRGLEGLHSPLIGREVELGQLSYAIDRLLFDQQGSLVVVMGEAGLGKSRLTEELTASIEPGSINIYEGHSLTYRKAIPFWIYQDVVRDILGVPMGAPAEEVRKRLAHETQAILGAAAVEALPYLEHLLSIKPSDTGAAERISYLDAGQLRQQIFLAVRDLLLGLARQKPVLLILEDLHWADETSLDLTLFLLESIRHTPLVIYAITRPYDSGVLSQIVERAKQRLVDRFIFIRLHALAPDQSKALFQSLLTVQPIPELFREQIIQRAAGIPFYLEEILRMLIEDKVIISEADHWIVSPGKDIDKIGVPDTLQDLILTRFDRLPPFNRQVLQTASVIGNQFGADVLHAVLPAVSKEDTAAALGRLVEKEYILPQPGTETASTEALYVFKHVLVSDAIYSTLLQRDRHDLHGRVGQAIEILYASRLEGQIELLANHYMRSMMLDRALIYLILAGQKAARGYANEQARQHFIQALGLLPKVRYTLDQLQGIHIGLGDVLVTIGEYQSARDHYQTALDAIEEDGLALPDMPHWQEKSVLFRKIATTFERQGEYDKTMGRLTAAQDAIDHLDTPPAVECARILNDMGWIFFRRGNLEQAEACLKEALNLAETRKEMGVELKDIKLKAGIFGAEPWSENMRRDIEKLWDIDAIDIYGLSEIMGPGVACECLGKKGLHVFEDHFIPEIIDPETGKQVLPGKKGELVFTTITKEGMPLIRYRTRDITRMLTDKCKCGRTSIRMERLSGRTDDMLIIRGVNVFPSEIEMVILGVEGVEPHYQIVVDRAEHGLDTMEVQVEVTSESFSDKIGALEQLNDKIADAVEHVLSIRVQVTLVEPNTIQRSEGKAKRVIDRRLQP